MKIIIAFVLGAWFGFGMCALLSTNQDNKFEAESRYGEDGHDLLPTDGNLYDAGG